MIHARLRIFEIAKCRHEKSTRDGNGDTRIRNLPYFYAFTNLLTTKTSKHSKRSKQNTLRSEWNKANLLTSITKQDHQEGSRN